jgi:hypothetical protein
VMLFPGRYGVDGSGGPEMACTKKESKKALDWRQCKLGCETVIDQRGEGWRWAAGPT